MGVAVVDDQRLVEPLGHLDVRAERLAPARPGRPRRCGSGRARSRRPRAPCRGPRPAARSRPAPRRAGPRPRAAAPRWGAGRPRRRAASCAAAASTAQRAPGRSQPICTIRGDADGGRRARGRPRCSASRRRRCRGGSGCRRPGAAAARAPAAGRSGRRLGSRPLGSVGRRQPELRDRLARSRVVHLAPRTRWTRCTRS